LRKTGIANALLAGNGIFNGHNYACANRSGESNVRTLAKMGAAGAAVTGAGAVVGGALGAAAGAGAGYHALGAAHMASEFAPIAATMALPVAGAAAIGAGVGEKIISSEFRTEKSRKQDAAAGGAGKEKQDAAPRTRRVL